MPGLHEAKNSVRNVKFSFFFLGVLRKKFGK